MKSRILYLAGVAALAAALSACSLGKVGDDDPSDGVDAAPSTPTPPAPPAPPSPPPPPVQPDYQRASMRPLFQLTPTGDFQRFEIFGERMDNDDFESGATQTSIEQKLTEIGTQIALERGEPVDQFIDSLYINIGDRGRADAMPFRGKPQDVDFLEVDNVRKAYVPLGGDISFPGNEVAVVNLDNNQLITRVKVGIRPTKVFADDETDLVFVINEYSNYISIIDSRDDEPLEGPDGQKVELPSDFYNRDLLLVERNINIGEDEFFLYVTNEYRASLMKYSIDIIRDNLDDVADVIINPRPGEKEHVPLAEITGVGKNPYSLTLSDSQTQVYVTNNRGGEIALVNISDDRVVGYTQINGPTVDVVQILDKVFIATTTLQRGYLNDGASATPDEVDVGPQFVQGQDGGNAQAHPGSLFDDTDSYNFEDVRNTIAQMDSNLNDREPDEIVDANEADVFYGDAQKQLKGALPWSIARNQAGNQIFVAMHGSDLVQTLNVNVGANIRLADAGQIFPTSELPSAVALDEDNGKLLVATSGGDFLEVFDIASGERDAQINLGYAAPRYPATTMEAGEYFFVTARWSGDGGVQAAGEIEGGKSCVSCHVDKYQVDGLPFANGATAPTMPHQVKPNWNLMETDNYFWNGTFVNNSYASLAYAAQSRTNCELVLFALIEGPDSDPAQRVGDQANFSSDAVVGRNAADNDSDVNCRPVFDRDDEPGILTDDRLATMPGPITGIDINGIDGQPDGRSNFLDIAGVIALQKQVTFQATADGVQDQLLRAGLQVNRDDVSRAMDFYGAAWLRLPPNPISQLRELQLLSSGDEAKIAEGERIFNDVAKCGNCHDPNNRVAPFADNRDHGGGGDWIQEFIDTYDQDPTLRALIADGVPDQMDFTGASGFTNQEINYHQNPLDFFEPFCFDDENCLRFDDPLGQENTAEEEERLFRLTLVNLADPDRGFVPGQVVGQARVNTPSLRGVWMQHNLLRHGLARSFREAILPPGHAALREGEIGWAVDRRTETNVHGETRDLSVEEVEALELYLQTIE